MLSQEENISMSRETVRQWLRVGGIKPKRKRRPPRHCGRRPSKELAGLMFQWDVGPHAWLGPDRPRCLMDAVGGAADIPACTPVGNDSCRSLAELGVESIGANSPRGKGRAENRFNPFQDRLFAEMRLCGITVMEQKFIDRYNKRFAPPPAQSENAHISISSEQIEHLVNFACEAALGKDNAVPPGGLIVDIPPGRNHFSYAGKRVLVRQHLDGSWSVWRDRQTVAQLAPTERKESVRTWKKRPGQSSAKSKALLRVCISSKPSSPHRGVFPFCS
jgi:hypothetical protein